MTQRIGRPHFVHPGFSGFLESGILLEILLVARYNYSAGQGICAPGRPPPGALQNCPLKFPNRNAVTASHGAKTAPKSHAQTWIRISGLRINWLETVSSQTIDSR